MGLDITAYKGLRKVENPNLDEDGNPVDWDNNWLAQPACIAWADEHFPGRSAGIEPGAVYTFTDKLGFRAGSYGGYNVWRQWLANSAGYAGHASEWQGHGDRPFYELVWFADNEGVIGPKVAAKLAKDFAEHEDRIVAASATQDTWFVDQYRTWRKAFEMAADNGAVDFH